MSKTKLANSILKRMAKGVGYGGAIGATTGANLAHFGTKGIINDAQRIQGLAKLKQPISQETVDTLALGNYGIAGLGKEGLTDNMFNKVRALQDAGDAGGLAKLLEDNANYYSPDIMDAMTTELGIGGAGLGLAIGALRRNKKLPR